ncbi:flagellar assembly protein FliW [Sporolituus thermophilus]|uniref:Flagellar assembly factor FliW n=1 Tax=Sporolituus thermophilus DSM 23256 TaxID=1123285 RepID=A0A1G7NZV4_9FIRM|nr:flagellar assembly protein FliW [Sporolituus thermophilus]SDF79598.1 flagellar assembly factor FliW [Sporolituus thermophilus DSM 23256]
MLIKSTRFGELDVPDEQIIAFPQGLPGFPSEKAFALLPHQPDSPFAFLQSAADPDLTFLVVEPFAFFPDYQFELDDATTAALKLAADNPPLVLSIVTVRTSLSDATANLLAPVVINRLDRLGAQVVLEKVGYTTRHRLFPDKPAAAQGGK